MMCKKVEPNCPFRSQDPGYTLLFGSKPRFRLTEIFDEYDSVPMSHVSPLTLPLVAQNMLETPL